MVDTAVHDQPGALQAEDPIEKIILRSLNEGVITLECNGSIHSVNAAALRILGLTEHNPEGRLFSEVFADPQNRSFREVFDQVLHQGVHALNEEVRYARPDGSNRDLSVATSFLEFDVCSPGMESVVVVLRDVTAFKALERMRRRAVSHLSHELKTPLAVIRASVESLEKHGLGDDRLTKPLGRIQRSVRRLIAVQDLVEEILNPPPYRPEDISLRPFMETLLSELRAEAAHRSVEIIPEIEDIRTDTVDPGILSLVVRSLVKNAIENTPDQGSVTVVLERSDGRILLEVRDCGVGIPAADQAFIFEGFHHTQPTEEYSTKRPYEFNAGGSGLELLRLKILAETGYFTISFAGSRCRHIPTSRDHCPGAVASCAYIEDPAGCRESGGTTFTVLFR